MMKTSPMEGVRDTFNSQALVNASNRFRKIILWGLKPPNYHTHFYVYQAYFQICKKFGLNVEWLNESESNVSLIEPEDLVFIHGSTNFLIANVILRNPVIVDFHVDVNQERLGDLVKIVSEYTRRITERERHEKNSEYLDSVTSFDPISKILTQPWGTDLLETEFSMPANSYWSDKMYWIGSWWKDDFWGNYNEICELKKVTEDSGLNFIQLTDCGTKQNNFFVSKSRIGPAIAGAGQIEHNYLACRFFKNISYGQFSISNVPKSQEILQGTAIYDSSVSQVITKALEVEPLKAKELVRFQQYCIRNYTVAAHLYLVMLAAAEYSL